MQNVADVIAIWPTDAELARELGVPFQTVWAWKQRGSIPAAYWNEIVQAARWRGHPEITADLLALLHARETKPGQPTGFSEEKKPMMPPLASNSDLSSDNRPPATAGHFSRWKHLRRPHFASAEDIAEHISALRDEWERR